MLALCKRDLDSMYVTFKTWSESLFVWCESEQGMSFYHRSLVQRVPGKKALENRIPRRKNFVSLWKLPIYIYIICKSSKHNYRRLLNNIKSRMNQRYIERYLNNRSYAGVRNWRSLAQSFPTDRKNCGGENGQNGIHLHHHLHLPLSYMQT